MQPVGPDLSTQVREVVKILSGRDSTIPSVSYILHLMKSRCLEDMEGGGEVGLKIPLCNSIDAIIRISPPLIYSVRMNKYQLLKHESIVPVMHSPSFKPLYTLNM